MPVDAGTIYSEVRIQLDKLKGDIKQIEARLDQFGAENKTQSQKVEKSWTDSFKKINIAGVLAFAAITMAVKSSIDTFAKFEQSMANVRSVTNASAEDFKKLEDAAIDAGESTRFTASQAADALYYLASAGLDAKQSINALQGVLQLAGATGSDLAFTSATMAATLSQFSLNAEESTRVSNVLAAAISNSQATMEKLSSSLKTVGPISGAFNISIEETVATLEALYNKGLAGEEAGTALRNILLSLADASGPVVKSLEAVGIAYDDIDPRKVGLVDAIDVLANSGADLATIFDKRVVAAMLGLAETGGDALRELQEEITNTNAAAEMYAIQNDTLAGSMDFLKSALETTSIEMVKMFEPALKGVVDFLTQAVKAFNALPGPMKTAIAVMATAGPVLAGVGSAIAFIAGGLTGIIGLVSGIGAIIGVTGILSSMTATARETQMINMALEQAVKNGQDINSAMNELARNTGVEKEKIEAVALNNDKINESLILQNEENQKIINAYSERASLLGAELEINNALLTENGLLGAVYRQYVDTVLEGLEAKRQAAQLTAEENQQQEQLAQEQEAREQKIQDLKDEFRRLNQTEEQNALEDLARQRDEFILAGIDAEEWYQEERRKIRLKFAEQSGAAGGTGNQQEIDDTEKLIQIKEQYKQKLDELTQSEIERLEAQRQATIDSIYASEADLQAKDDAINAVNEYYDALIDDTANQIFRDNFMAMTETVLSGFQGLLSAMASLSQALTDQQLADLDRWLQAELEAQGLVEETTLERLQDELAAAIEAGDTELAEQLRQDIAREQLEQEYERRAAQIKYEGELRQWRYTLAIGIASAASAVLSGFATKPFLPVGLAAGILATAKSAIQLAAIRAQKPQPPSAATGGIVIPAGPDGVDVTTAENGSPELLLNSGTEGEQFLNDFASRIAAQLNGGGSGTITVILNMDGKQVAENTARYYNNGIIRLNLT